MSAEIEVDFDCEFERQVRAAELFLRQGEAVELHFKFRGREMAHVELGFTMIRQALFELVTVGRVECEPKLVGRNIRASLSPLR